MESREMPLINLTGMRALSSSSPKLLSDSSILESSTKALIRLALPPFSRYQRHHFATRNQSNQHPNFTFKFPRSAQSFTHRHVPPTNMSELFSCHEGLEPPGRHLIQGGPQSIYQQPPSIQKRTSRDPKSNEMAQTSLPRYEVCRSQHVNSLDHSYMIMSLRK